MGELSNYDCTIKHEEDEFGLVSLVTTDEQGREYRWRYKVTEGGGIQFILSSDWGSSLIIQPEVSNAVILKPRVER